MHDHDLIRRVFPHLVRLVKNLFGVMVGITLFGALLSRLLDPNAGIMTLGIYLASWTLAFFLVGISTQTRRWLHVIAVASLFFAMTLSMSLAHWWKIAFMLFTAALIGGTLSHLARRNN